MTRDLPLEQLRRWAVQITATRRSERLRLTAKAEPSWKYHNTFLGRKVERNEETGEFRIIGGQVQVSL